MTPAVGEAPPPTAGPSTNIEEFNARAAYLTNAPSVSNDARQVFNLGSDSRNDRSHEMLAGTVREQLASKDEQIRRKDVELDRLRDEIRELRERNRDLRAAERFAIWLLQERIEVLDYVMHSVYFIIHQGKQKDFQQYFKSQPPLQPYGDDDD